MSALRVQLIAQLKVCVHPFLDGAAASLLTPQYRRGKCCSVIRRSVWPSTTQFARFRMSRFDRNMADAEKREKEGSSHAAVVIAVDWDKDVVETLKEERRREAEERFLKRLCHPAGPDPGDDAILS